MARALAVEGLLALVACGSTSSMAPLASQRQDPRADPNLSIFVVTTRIPHEYVYKGQHVQRNYGSSSRETWRLERGTHEVRLSVQTSYEDGRSELSEYRGVPDENNGGVPVVLREQQGRLHIKLHCKRSIVTVHQRDAVFSLRCNADGDRFDGWTSSVESIPVLECEQEFRFDDDNNILYLTTPLIFGDVPIERLVTQCCAFDMCDPYAGLRFAG